MDINVCRFHFDGEMLGSIPGKHPLVEIGCCNVVPRSEMKTFEGLIRPFDAPYEYGARRVLRRSYEEYMSNGEDGRDVAHRFIDYLHSTAGGRKIEISCVNPGFDIGFLKVFLDAYANDEVTVIGYKTYDVVSYACGVFKLPLSEMSKGKAWEMIKQKSAEIYNKYFPGEMTHNALQDAIDQTALLLALEECAVSTQR